jgi:transposase
MSGKQIAANETAAATLVQHADGWVLTTIPGVNNLLVACYLAAIGGDILRFPTAAHLWSYAGFDPIECDSGNHLGTGLISKQGSPYLRTVLFQMAFLASTNHPGSARVYVRARQRGLQETPAVIHVAHYLNTVCFAMLCNQQPYEERMPAEKAAHWIA